MLPLVEALRIDVIEGPTAAELGAVVGKEGTAAIGVLDAALANGIRAAAKTAAAKGV